MSKGPARLNLAPEGYVQQLVGQLPWGRKIKPKMTSSKNMDGIY